MTEAFGGSIDQCCEILKLDFSSSELAQMAAEKGFSQATLDHIGDLFAYLKDKKEQTTIQTILRMSRLPQKAPKTFENFDFSVLRGKGHIDLEKLESIRTLAPVYAHRNLAFIGPAGTGKTHLAQAFGYECCKHGLKTYFIKASELRDKFTTARRAEKTASMLTSLVRPSCLIIDEIGHCEFDKENTRLFLTSSTGGTTRKGHIISSSPATEVRPCGERISMKKTLCSAPLTVSLMTPPCSTSTARASGESGWRLMLCRQGKLRRRVFKKGIYKSGLLLFPLAKITRPNLVLFTRPVSG